MTLPSRNRACTRDRLPTRKLTSCPGPLQDVREVSRETLEPILFLLQSHDVEVQRAASAALGNLGVNSEFSRFESGAGSWLMLLDHTRSRKQGHHCQTWRIGALDSTDAVSQRRSSVQRRRLHYQSGNAW